MARIAIISCGALETPPTSYGGAEAVAWESAELLTELGEVTLYGSDGSWAKRADVVECGPPSFTAQSEVNIQKAFEKDVERYDVLVDHSHMGFAYRSRLKNPRLKMVKVFHDLLPCPLPPPPDSYHVLAGVSNWHGRYLSEQWGREVIGLPNGVPLDKLRFSEEREDFLLFLARVIPQKGAHHFLDIVEATGAKAVLAGEDSAERGIDPDFRDAVLRRAEALGVDYRGRVAEGEKLRLLSKARAVVVPLDDSYREAFGLWAVEGLASGAPVFSLDRGAVGEIVLSSTGAVCGSLEELGSEVGALVQGKKWYAPKVCRERAEEFSVEKMGERYLSLIKSLADGGH